jgi:ribokinase
VTGESLGPEAGAGAGFERSDRPVIVIGHAVVDVLTRAEEALVPGSDARAEVHLTMGGSASNTAAWLAHLGVDVTLVASVGADPAGAWVRDDLSSHGVKARLVEKPGQTTGVLVALVDEGGERSMLTSTGANAALAVSDLPGECFRPGAHLHLSGYTLFEPGSRAAGLEALRLAGLAGMTVSVDPNSVAPLGAVVSQWHGWVAGDTWLLPNLEEARLLVEHSPPADSSTDRPAGAALAAAGDVAAALARSYAEVVVTAGPDGAVWASGDRTAQRRITDVTMGLAVPVVDTVGAGDAFAAGYLTARLAGMPGPVALDHALLVAARSLGRRGGRPPRPASGL